MPLKTKSESVGVEYPVSLDLKVCVHPEGGLEERTPSVICAPRLASLPVCEPSPDGLLSGLATPRGSVLCRCHRP
jgi:hypothetical protein